MATLLLLCETDACRFYPIVQRRQERRVGFLSRQQHRFAGCLAFSSWVTYIHMYIHTWQPSRPFYPRAVLRLLLHLLRAHKWQAILIHLKQFFKVGFWSCLSVPQPRNPSVEYGLINLKPYSSYAQQRFFAPAFSHPPTTCLASPIGGSARARARCGAIQRNGW